MPPFLRRSVCLALPALVLFSACRRPVQESAASPAGPPSARWERVAHPADSSASAAAFHVTDDRLFMTWVEKMDGKYTLRQAEFDDPDFKGMRTITGGDGWMLHWADLPGAAGSVSDLYAWHQLKNPADAHASDIRLYRAVGNRWEGPFEVHAPTPVGEHAFVSASALPDGTFGMAWLQPSPAGKGTELAFRSYHTGKATDIVVLDSLVCDCCPTAMAGTDSTVIVAYRDRSPDNVRDISYQVWDRGVWSGPKPLGAEGWQIDGCPVNGPAVAARGPYAVIVWWTQVNGQGEVRYALSENYGWDFGPAKRLDEANPIGQVGAAMDEEGDALLTWVAPLDKGRNAIYAYNVAQALLDTVAIVPAQQAVGKPVVTANSYGRFLIAWKGAKGIEVIATTDLAYE